MIISKQETALWGYTELTLEAGFGGNPFTEVELTGIFEKGGRELQVPGFYDGDNVWKIRFMPVSQGEWSFRTESSLAALAGKTGTIICTDPAPGVHGPVSIADEVHFAYADGTPYRPVGTTCYVWNHQGIELENKTLKTLENSPFNKIRFCVFPKRYTFNYNEPETYPFPGEVKTKWNPENQDDYTPRKTDFWDLDHFNPLYFRHLDECVLKLMNLGIEADLILFHPYDFGAWGFDSLPEEVNNRLLEYLVARLGAFRNIWWAFANEYDLFQNKAIHEWDRYMKLVEKEDPYQHLRSIHNCRGFFDHTKPWITHCSIQSGDFKRIPQWFEMYKKPLVIDECCYEGNINRDWGNISGREMTHRFWMGFASAAYTGHGETYLHPDDILWWSKGGDLHGQSPERIGFLSEIIQDFPSQGVRVFKPGEGFMPKPGEAMGCGVYPEYGLFYFGVHQPSFRMIDLPDEGSWEIDILDTWEMTVTPGGRNLSGSVRIELPGKEGIAIRIRRQ